MLRKKKRTPKPASGNSKRIFVAIASYRDPECQWTVKDLFEKADNPDNIFVGICWQYDEADDMHCFEEPYARPEQVRRIGFDYTESKGACWAVYQAQLLWMGEEYCLQIDSHMRFDQGWDTAMLEMLEATGNKKALLSCYPAGYTPPNNLEGGAFPIMMPVSFNDYGIPWFQSMGMGLSDSAKRPIKSHYIAAGYLFGRAEFIHEVPSDPYLYFLGQEITLALRAYTHGWDVYTPHRNVIYHFYNELGKEGRSHNRSNHWDDQKKRSNDLESYSRQRVQYLLTGKPAEDAQALEDIKHYGCGKKRTLADFEAATGISLSRRMVLPASANIAYRNYQEAGGPGIPDSHYFFFANTHIQNGKDHENVLAHIGQALVHISDLGLRYTLHIEAARYFEKQDDGSKQIEALLRAIGIMPTRAEGYIAIVLFYMKYDKWDNALPFARAAFDLRKPEYFIPDTRYYSWYPFALAAVCAGKTGEKELAVQYAREALLRGAEPADVMQRIITKPDDSIATDHWVMTHKKEAFDLYRAMDDLPDEWKSWVQQSFEIGANRQQMQMQLRHAGFREEIVLRYIS